MVDNKAKKEVMIEIKKNQVKNEINNRVKNEAKK